MPGRRIEIEAEDGWIEAYAAHPSGAPPWPSIILLSDRGGLRPAIQAMASRLADQGFFVLAPDPFNGCTAEDLDTPAEAFDAWFDFLQAERLADETRTGVVGYGLGAALALRLAAAHAERVAASALFCGGRPTPDEALHLASCMNGVLHLGHAAQDSPRSNMPAVLETALRRADVDFESCVYPAGRGFAVPDHPGYDRRAAELHWANLVELFRRVLQMPRR